MLKVDFCNSFNMTLNAQLKTVISFRYMIRFLTLSDSDLPHGCVQTRIKLRELDVLIEN